MFRGLIGSASLKKLDVSANQFGTDGWSLKHGNFLLNLVGLNLGMNSLINAEGFELLGMH